MVGSAQERACLELEEVEDKAKGPGTQQGVDPQSAARGGVEKALGESF